MRRIVLIALALMLTPAPAQSQGRSCSNFTLGPNQQIAACNALITNFNNSDSAPVRITPADRLRYVLFLHRGAAYARSGDSAMAKSDFERAVALAKKALDEGGKPLPREYDRSCWVHAMANIEPELALDHCNKAVSAVPKSALVHDSRALLYLRLDRTNDALNDFTEALRINPKLASSLYGRGVAKLRLGDVEGAKADLFQAERLRPGTHAEFAAFGFTQ